MDQPGVVVILNGMPRTGKTSIAEALQADPSRTWINVGMDHHIRTLPSWLSPGAGLRPYAVEHAGEHRERLLRIEMEVPRLYEAIYASAAAHARQSLDVVMDVAHHKAYSRPIDTLAAGLAQLDGLTRLFVGVTCSLDEVWRRRKETWGQSRNPNDAGLIAAVEGGHTAIHDGHDYDLVVDTTSMSAADAARTILRRLADAGSSSDA